MVGRKEEQHDNGSKRVVCNPEKLNAKTELHSYNILTLFRTYTLLTTLTTLLSYLSIYWDGGAKTQLPSTKEGNVTGLEYAEDTGYSLGFLIIQCWGMSVTLALITVGEGSHKSPTVPSSW